MIFRKPSPGVGMKRNILHFDVLRSTDNSKLCNLIIKHGSAKYNTAELTTRLFYGFKGKNVDKIQSKRKENANCCGLVYHVARIKI